MDETIIAIDPGREKCGIAVVNRQGGTLWKKVVGAAELAARVAELARAYTARTVVLGDRTAHKDVLRELNLLSVDNKPLDVKLVDEHHSSDEARSRYWREHPPKGLGRLIPVTLRVPPGPVDDEVAVILAERYFRGPCE